MLGRVPQLPGNFGLCGTDLNCESKLKKCVRAVFPCLWRCQTCFWFVFFVFLHSSIRLFYILFSNQLDVNSNAPWFWWCKSGMGSAPLVAAPETSSKGEHGRPVDFFVWSFKQLKVWHDICTLYFFVYDCTKKCEVLVLVVGKGSVTDMHFDWATQMLNASGCWPAAQRWWVQG